MSEIPALFLQNHPLFKDLLGPELEIVQKILHLKELDMDEILFTEGAPANSMGLVLQGSLDVIKRTKSGENVLIATLGDGQSVGEMAVVDGMVRSATVKATMYTQVVLLHREHFETLLEKYPRVGEKMLRGIARVISLNLRKTSERLTALMMPIT